MVGTFMRVHQRLPGRAGLRLPPFIVTLGMWQIVLAANFLYSANETIRSQDIAEQAAPLLQFFGEKIQHRRR